MKKHFATMLILLSTMYACKKEPGTGGDCEITGQVRIVDYNGSFTGIIGEYPAEDEYVYIVYGDHVGYDKRIKTDYNGYFRFSYLYPGDYTIYAYSADTSLTELDGQVAVITKVHLDDRKQEKNIGTISIAK